MTREELNVIQRIAITRAIACVDDTMTEFKCREMGHVDAEALIESIRQRVREDLLNIIPLPDGR